MEIRSASWDDFETVCELLATRSRAVHGISDVRLDTVRADWELPSFEVGRDNWVATDGVRVTGYAAVGPTRDLIHVANNAAAADALLEAAATRARERAFDLLQIVVSVVDERLHAFVERHGFTRGSEILRMWKTLDDSDPDPVWPSETTVRTYEPGDAEAVKKLLDEAYAAWDATYVPRTQDDWLGWMTGTDDFEPAVWFLAETDGDLAGCALNWRTGWVKDIAVRERLRGHGLATALLQHGFRELVHRGVPRAGLKVDAANPTGAVRLYERLGFVVDRREWVWTLCL